ncbi:MAG: hypothetical protein IJ821_07340 [Lachnospiraceae bacterium]|nr:hypothetical protein [Lachnospiraceae bacterium]
MKKLLIMFLCIMLLTGCGQTAVVDDSTAENPVEESTPNETEGDTTELTEDSSNDSTRYTIYDVSFELPSTWSEYQSTDNTLSFFPEQNNTKNFIMVSSYENGYNSEKYTEEDAIQMILTTGFETFGFDAPNINYDTLLNGKKFGWDLALNDSSVYHLSAYANDGKALSYVIIVPKDDQGALGTYIDAVYHSMETIEYVD